MQASVPGGCGRTDHDRCGGAAHWALAADAQSDLEKQGETLINARCIACHSAKSLIKFVARCAEQRSDAYLDDFVIRHHAPDETARAAIIAYLTCQLDDAVP